MDIRPDMAPKPLRSSIWLGIGVVLFTLILALLFFVLASHTLRQEWDQKAPPAGTAPAAPTAPGPVIPH